MAKKKTKAPKRTKTKKTSRKKKVDDKIDIESLIIDMHAKINEVESKLDSVLVRLAGLSSKVSAERDPSFKTRASVTKTYTIPNDKPHKREKRMHQVVCAECKQVCEVPFIPKAGRPVFCKTCYTSRKSKPREVLPDRDELVKEISRTLNVDMSKPSRSKTSKAKKAKTRTTKAGTTKKAAVKKTTKTKTKAKTKKTKKK